MLFGRESIESSFSSGFFLLKKRSRQKKKEIAVRQPFELLQLNDFAKRLLMMQSKVTLCFCTRNGKKHGIGGVHRGNSLSETDGSRAANFY